jgi:hypothetical protein
MEALLYSIIPRVGKRFLFVNFSVTSISWLTSISWTSGYVHGQDVKSLLAASVRGDLLHVRQCISAGEDLKAKTEYGVIALSVACDHGHQALVYKSQTGFYIVRTSEKTLSLFDPAQERTITLKVGEDNI